MFERIKKMYQVLKSISLNDANALSAAFPQYFRPSQEYSGWVAKGIEIWGSYFSQSKFRLYKVKGDDMVEVFKHPFLDMKNKPNPYQYWHDFMTYKAIGYGLFGSFYILKLRDRMGVWRQSYVLLSGLVTPVSLKDNGIVDYYQYGSNRLDAGDVIRLKLPSPYSFTQGSSVISKIFDQVEVDGYQSRYLRKYYKEGGFMGLTFSTPLDMSPSSFEKTKKELQKAHSGLEGSFKVALFDNDLKPVKAAYSLKDMDITAQRKLSRQEILGAFGVPEVLLGMGEGVNRATTDSQLYAFAKVTIDPLLSYFDEVMTREIQLEFDRDDLYLLHDTVAVEDVKTRIDYYKGMTSIGAMAIDEVRVEERYPRFKMPLTSVPILNLGGAAIRIDTGEQLGQVPNNVNTPKTKNFDIKWKQFDIRHQRLSVQLERDVNKYWVEQRHRIELNINKDFFNVVNIFDSQEEMKIWINMIENYFIRAMEQSYYLSGGSNFVLNTLYLDQLKQQTSKVIETTNKILKEKVEGINLTKEELNKILDDVYKDFEKRSPLIAVTSMTAAFNLGALQGLKSTGKTTKTWITQMDGKERDIHFEANGQTTGIDDPFLVGGELMQFPGDPSASANNTANCRCYMA